MKQQEQLLNDALKGNDAALVELTMLIQNNKIDSLLAKKILGNVDQNNLPLRYLESCLYAYGAEIGEPNSQKSLEILSRLIEDHQYSFAYNLAGEMFRTGSNRGMSRQGFYEIKKPAEDYELTARVLANPLALFNYLNTHQFEEYKEWFQMLEKCYAKLPKSQQRILLQRINDLESQLKKNNLESDKDAWLNLAKYYRKAGPGYESKLAQANLYAAKYGDIESLDEVTASLRNINTNQQLSLINRFQDSVSHYIEFAKKESYRDKSNIRLSTKLNKLQQDGDDISMEFNIIQLLPQLYPKNKAILTSALDNARTSYDQYAKTLSEAASAIAVEMKKQTKVAEDRGLVTESEQLQTQKIENLQLKMSKMVNSAEEKSQITVVMHQFMVKRLTELSEEIENIVLNAKKPTFSILGWFAQKEKPKSGLEEKLISLLNFPKMNMSELEVQSNLADQLQQDCQKIASWLDQKEKAFGGTPSEEFTKSKEAILLIRDSFSEMCENLRKVASERKWRF